MKKKSLTAYALVKNHRFSRHTIHRLRHNIGISTAMVNELCGILDCRVEDILLYVPDKTGAAQDPPAPDADPTAGVSGAG